MPLWTTIKLTTPHLSRRLAFSPRNSTHSIIPYSDLHTRHMPRLTGKALVDDIANTILEDSEPERQAEEAKQEEKRRKQRKQKQRSEGAEAEARAEVSDEIIVVSESERNNLALRSVPKCRESSVIEIGDVSGSNLENITISPATPPRLGLAFSQRSEQEIQDILGHSLPSHSATDTDDADHYGLPIDLTACIVSSSQEQDSIVPKLNIARFAFSKNPRPSTVPKLGYALSRQFSNTSTSEDNAPAAKTSKASKNAASFPSIMSSFTMSQLTALSRCVVCNLAWTTRKTVPVKVSHIKSCARKNTWNEETVLVGLTKEIGHISADTNNNEMLDSKKRIKGKGKEIAHQGTKTFLEDVVNDAAPRKRRQRVRDVDVTVLKPQDAHAAIMERAKALLGPPALPSSSAQDVGFPSTQIFGPSKLGASGPSSGVFDLGMLEDQTARLTSDNIVDPGHKASRAGVDGLPPSTQTFRTSALAGKSAKGSMFYGDENENGEQSAKNDTTGMPPTTQVFRPSGLATKLGHSRQSLLDSNEDASTFPVDNPNADQIQARPLKPFQSTMKPLLAATRPRTYNKNLGTPSTSSSVNEEHLYIPVTLSKRSTDLDHRLGEIRTGLQDGKVRLDPHPILPSEPLVTKITRKRGVKRTGNVCSVSEGKRKARDGSSSSSCSPSKAKSRSRSRSRKPSSRPNSRSPRKNQQEKDCSDSEALDDDLYRIIKEDKVLYERILRYEPIHFDVFLKLSGIQEMDSAGFKLKLRAFLDRQAINFYGALASNRTRYK